MKTCEVNKDFISNLPDPILLHILSFLPLQDAIKTVLLRGFGKLWLSMPVLDFDTCLSHKCDEYGEEGCYYDKFTDIFQWVWNHRDDITLDKLRLNFPFFVVYSGISDNENLQDWEKLVMEKEKADADPIEKLVGYALSRKVKVLDFKFRGCASLIPEEEYYTLPDLFSSNYLRDLRLSVCSIRLCEKINLNGLAVLFLDDVSLSDEAMEKILLGCPCLEDLTVIDCGGLDNLKCENPNLKKVMVRPNSESMHFQLSCHYVLSLKIGGCLEHASLLDVSSLVDAEIFTGNLKFKQETYVNTWNLLRKIRSCESFSPSMFIILVMSIWELKHYRGLFFKWKNVILKLELTKWHLPGLYYLFRGCPSLETLTMYISPDKNTLFKSDVESWIWEHDFDRDGYWDSREAKFPCLESITIYGHINEPCLIQTVKFLLKTAPKLQRMEISTKKTERKDDLYTSEQLLELSQKLLAFPRASTNAMIYFS